LIEHLSGTPGIEKITPAGSLRRGRETVGDLDILVTGKIMERDRRSENGNATAAIEKTLAFPGILEVLVKGDDKVSFKLRSGMQVDVRFLSPNPSAQRCSISPDRKTTTLICDNGR